MCKVVFLLIRPLVVFHRSPALPSPLSITQNFIFCLNKLLILLRASLLALAKSIYYSLKGRQKDVSSVAILWHLQPRKWINRWKQQEERIRRPDTVWLFKWKEVNRILKEYIFIYSSVSFSFFCRRVNPPNGRKSVSIFVKNMACTTANRLLFLQYMYLYFSWGLGMPSFRAF